MNNIPIKVAMIGGIFGLITAIINKLGIITITAGVAHYFFILLGIVIATVLILGHIYFSKNKKINMQDHPIFTQFIYWKRYIHNGFELSNHGKELIFKEILDAHLDSFETKLSKLHCETKNIHNLVEFKNKHICILYEITDSLGSFFNKLTYSEDDKETLNMVIPKFNRWCNPSYELVADKIEEICESNLYTDNRSRNVVILLSYQIILSMIILNASKTLNDLNGELKGMSFKGVVIE